MLKDATSVIRTSNRNIMVFSRRKAENRLLFRSIQSLAMYPFPSRASIRLATASAANTSSTFTSIPVAVLPRLKNRWASSSEM